MVINTNVNVNLTTYETLSLGAAVNQNVQDALLPSFSYTNGTGSNQVQLHWELTGVTLAAGASVTYTLSALADTLGRTVALASVVALLIQVTARTAGDKLTVGNAATHPWVAPVGGATQTFAVYDCELKVAALTDGFAVTSGTSDQLLITNSGANPVTFNIALVGR